jgi:hypothetical protein
MAKKHPNVHFHFTPTHVSWLNQIEAWLSILSCGALAGASLQCVRELIQAIERFIAVNNETAMPFVWTKVHVSQKSPHCKHAEFIK